MGKKVCLRVLLIFININLVISNDELYQKFYQTDYKVDFEREAVVYFNESFGNLSHNTFKVNRTHFATNATIYLKVEMQYDFEVVVQAYKFLSNEYRIFPIHFEYNFCKGLKSNFAGLKNCIDKCGNVKCPLKKNIHYSICNCLIDGSKLPPFIPTGRFKLALEGRYKDAVFGITETYINIYRPLKPGQRAG